MTEKPEHDILMSPVRAGFVLVRFLAYRAPRSLRKRRIREAENPLPKAHVIPVVLRGGLLLELRRKFAPFRACRRSGIFIARDNQTQTKEVPNYGESRRAGEDHPEML